MTAAIPYRSATSQAMLPQQDGHGGDQQAAGRVVGGQQQARPDPVQQAPGHRRAAIRGSPKHIRTTPS